MHFYIPLIIFSLVSAVTPGPNNISLMMSSSAHGIRKTIPQCFGVILGYSVMLFIIGSGLGAIFIKFPIIHTIIKIFGSGFILCMAWKIINATIEKEGVIRGKPLTFMQALLFQWVNPKGLVSAISTISAYTDSHSHNSMMSQILIITLIALVVTSIGAAIWVFGGTIIKKLLKNNVHLKIFNYVMGAFLALSVIMIIFF